MSVHEKKQLGAQRSAQGKSKRSRDKKWDSYESAWATVQGEKEGKKVIFDKIEIADDGGLVEIGVRPELWSCTRYLSALITLIFAFYNVYSIIDTDIRVLLGKEIVQPEKQDYYLLGTQILEFILQGPLPFSQTKVTVVLELVMLVIFFVRIGFRFYEVTTAVGYKRWHAVDVLLWDQIPDISYFSSMQLLYYVTPAVLSPDIFFYLFYSPANRWKGLLGILISRPLALIIGLDSFLIKYRGALGAIVTGQFDITNLMSAGIFLNQVLGVVQVRWVIKRRLFRFVFGGEDGVMTDRETRRMDIWKAMVAQKIFERYPCHKALTLMLSWSDDDFQLLVLNDENPDGGVESLQGSEVMLAETPRVAAPSVLE